MLGIFNIKKMRRPPKTVDSCAILGIFNIKKIRTLPKIILLYLKMKMGQ